VVTPGYFEFFRVQLLAGRDFDARDRGDGLPVAVVSDRVAEAFGGPAAALGKRLKLGGPEDEGDWLTIVGVVPTVVQVEVRTNIQPNIYVPLAQNDLRFMSIAMRTVDDPLLHTEALQRAVMELDPDLPVYWLRSLEEWVDEARFMPRFLAALFGLFAATGLVLAAAGLYGVLAYTVVVRTQEFGVRRALGATGGGIVALLVRQGTLQTTIGLGCGVVIASLFARLLSNEFYGVGAFDPLTFGLVVVVLAVTAALATLLPALRALAVDPARALRCE